MLPIQPNKVFTTPRKGATPGPRGPIPPKPVKITNSGRRNDEPVTPTGFSIRTSSEASSSWTETLVQGLQRRTLQEGASDGGLPLELHEFMRDVIPPKGPDMYSHAACRSTVNPFTTRIGKKYVDRGPSNGRQLAKVVLHPQMINPELLRAVRSLVTAEDRPNQQPVPRIRPFRDYSWIFKSHPLFTTDGLTPTTFSEKDVEIWFMIAYAIPILQLLLAIMSRTICATYQPHDDLFISSSEGKDPIPDAVLRFKDQIKAIFEVKTPNAFRFEPYATRKFGKREAGTFWRIFLASTLGARNVTMKYCNPSREELRAEEPQEAESSADVKGKSREVVEEDEPEDSDTEDDEDEEGSEYGQEEGVGQGASDAAKGKKKTGPSVNSTAKILAQIWLQMHAKSVRFLVLTSYSGMVFCYRKENTDTLYISQAVTQTKSPFLQLFAFLACATGLLGEGLLKIPEPDDSWWPQNVHDNSDKFIGIHPGTLPDSYALYEAKRAAALRNSTRLRSSRLTRRRDEKEDGIDQVVWSGSGDTEEANKKVRFI